MTSASSLVQSCLTALALFGTAWCLSGMYANYVMHSVARAAINHAKPCDLAAVLGALPETTRRGSAKRVDTIVTLRKGKKGSPR